MPSAASKASDRRLPAEPEAEDLLQLLRKYISIVASRPIDKGNQEYLSSLLSSIDQLGGSAVARLRGNSISSDIRSLIRTFRQAGAASVPAIARMALRQLDLICDRQLPTQGTERLYLDGEVSPLTRRYSHVSVMFGAGLGMGDEISFLQFLRALFRQYQDARREIFSIYPDLWQTLLPEVRSFHYRAKPLRPLRHISSHARRMRDSESGLLLVVDFDGYDYHRIRLLRHTSLDILELSLGLRKVWFARGDSPWVETEDFALPRTVDNYAFLQIAGSRLLVDFPAENTWATLQPSKARKRDRCRRVILLNPISSKPVPLAPGDWSVIFRRILEGISGRASLHAIVFPGLDASSSSLARDVVAALGEEEGVTAGLLMGLSGGPITPHDGNLALVRALDDVDLCITVDTFTAHMVPLFGVNTTVIELKDSRAFWVPSPTSFYFTLGQVHEELPATVSHLLGSPSEDAKLRYGEAVVRATEKAFTSSSTDTRDLMVIIGELARYAELPGSRPQFETWARQWLMFWSRLVSAFRREPVSRGRLVSYLHRWRSSNFYKILIQGTR
ncbi:MAG: hypothetical protein O7H41_16355 [Planctomycetota bacterium]|nr:hypothetical protein [Planctomycetota bacterium]